MMDRFLISLLVALGVTLLGIIIGVIGYQNEHKKSKKNRKGDLRKMDEKMIEIIKPSLEIIKDMIDLDANFVRFHTYAAAEIIAEDLQKAGYGNIKQAVGVFE